MRRVRKGFLGVETHLFASMLVQPQPQAEEEVEIPITPAPPSTTSAPSQSALQDPTPTPHATPTQDQPLTPHDLSPLDQPTPPYESSIPLLTTLMEIYATLSQEVAELEQDKRSQALEILQLKKRVKRLERKKKSKHSGFKRLRRVGEKIEDIDADEGITLVDVEKDEDVVSKDVEPWGGGGLNLEEVNAASKGVSVVSAPKLVSADEPIVFDDDDVKYPIIYWEIHSEGSRVYWKIIRVGGITKAYHIFEDMLKGFDREDFVALWNLVKEKFSLAVPSKDKEKALWVEQK
nr:hypothetical protein [Tanacetum cinerariifolium]